MMGEVSRKHAICAHGRPAKACVTFKLIRAHILLKYFAYSMHAAGAAQVTSHAYDRLGTSGLLGH